MIESMDNATEHFLILEETLRWYTQAGVDIAIDEMPHDRFAEALAEREATKPALRISPTLRIEPVSRLRVSAPDEAFHKASELAKNAQTLAELRTAMLNFDGCTLKATATQLVFGAGIESASIMLVGEAPGREEDLQGLPFVGEAGQLLTKMLAVIGLSREAVHLSNVVPWRPPGNRTPTVQEMAICKPFITRQIELIKPNIIITLGGCAAKVLLNEKQGILSLRGQVFNYMYGESSIKAIPMLHPAYLLRQPLQKRLAWKDLQIVQNMIV